MWTPASPATFTISNTIPDVYVSLPLFILVTDSLTMSLSSQWNTPLIPHVCICLRQTIPILCQREEETFFPDLFWTLKARVCVWKTRSFYFKLWKICYSYSQVSNNCTVIIIYFALVLLCITLHCLFETIFYSKIPCSITLEIIVGYKSSCMFILHYC